MAILARQGFCERNQGQWATGIVEELGRPLPMNERVIHNPGMRQDMIAWKCSPSRLYLNTIFFPVSGNCTASQMLCFPQGSFFQRSKEGLEDGCALYQALLILSKAECHKFRSRKCRLEWLKYLLPGTPAIFWGGDFPMM